MSPTQNFRQFALLVSCVAGGLASAWAGPEPIQASAKDKEIQVITPVCDPRWYLNLGGGADFAVDGNLTNGFNRDLKVQTLVGAFPARATGSSTNWNDVYEPAFHVQGEFGYVLTRHIELFGSFRYTHAEAVDRANDNQVLVNLIGPSVFRFSRDFGDYTSYGGEVGVRYFFLTKESRFRPFFSLSGGVNHVDSIDISTRVNLSSFGGPFGFEIYKGGFFDDSWVGTGTAQLGLEVRVACHWDLGVEGGIRYQSTLSQNDRDYRGFAPFDGLFAVPLKPFAASNNNAGDSWTVPLNAYVKYRF